MRKACFIFTLVAISCAFPNRHALAQSKIELSSLSPGKGPIGSVVTLRGRGFTAASNIVHFGSGGQRNVRSAKGGTEISYTIPSHLGPCQLYGCMAALLPVRPGRYPIYVSNARGRSNSLAFDVTK
jgi:IPT/TIG domain